ncbi:MAG: head decoration protein [Gemmataceae bacterium]|nr:head decoration protein [Gemmataceae bacterium]
MSLIASQFGNLPGIQNQVETYEAAIMFGDQSQVKWWNGYISSTARDTTNDPTYRLRPGLVLGKIAATGQWTNYAPTATDGSQIAGAILAYGLTLLDYLTGTYQGKFYAIVIGGNVHAANLIGLDGQARAQLSSKFTFDDDLIGDQWVPFPQMVAKTADYTVTASDNGTAFTNTGAVGAVKFTLPTLANGLSFSFRVVANQSVTVTSAAGNDMVAFNDATASSVAFSTPNEKIGGGFLIYSNPAATAWIVENHSAGANTVTVA